MREKVNLTTVASRLLQHKHFGVLQGICEDQKTVSTRKLHRLIDDVLEINRQIAVSIIQIRDRKD